MRVPSYPRATPERDLAMQADWLRDKRNLPMVLMAAAIMNKQRLGQGLGQDARSGPGNTNAGDGSGNTEAQ